MGTFRIDVELENPARPGTREGVNGVVDTGAELSWVPSEVLERLGIVRRKELHVVFGLPGDLVLLGARSLEGLNRRIDPIRKILVDAGPVPAAVAAA